LPLIDPSNAEERQKVQDFLDRLVERTLAAGGTCSGEHGIGQGKINYLAAEHGSGISPMIAIKKALDPLNILNPGKIFALP
jgi:D-lactate dehydrogenase (cytochrome)